MIHARCELEALIVREHQDLVFISHNGMVQRTSVRGISRYGRASQGVRLMNLREDDRVSAVALVVDAGGGTGRASDEEAALETELQAEVPAGSDGSAPDA